jgi:acetyl-CoA carboxylase biotin carboxylase subunit
MGDSRGRVACLGTRECSIQRRRQKLIEETPPPSQEPKVLENIMLAATRIGERAGYRNAGTVEFLVDSKHNFYFLEVNSRLQVEHPVTEMVTGLDLVKEQIRIAEGADLGYRTGEVRSAGAAIECRICAEDADQDFAPTVADIDYIQEPGGPWVRVDSMLLPHMPLAHYYDSLLSKLVTWGRTRIEAVARMRRALGEYTIKGTTTLLPFFRRVMENEEFLAGNYNTAFVDRMFAKGRQSKATPSFP